MKVYIRILSLILLFSGQATLAQPNFRTGVNFPFRNPETASIDTYFSFLQDLNVKAARQFTYADVFWGKVEPADNSWDFYTADSVFMNNYGITPVGELFGIFGPNDTVGLQVPWQACSNPAPPDNCRWNAATDSLATRDYIQQVVGRYKNNTIYWEVGNEMEHTPPPEGLALKGSNGASPDQVDFMKYVYNWIKAVDPNAQVLLPGMLGTYGYPFSNTTNWLNDFLSKGGGEYFDIMNYHDYNSWWTLPTHFDSIKAILNKYGYANKPIWISETSISSFNTSSITPDYASTDEQAADTWRRITLLWAKGAQVAFWHSLWSSGDLSGWGEFGLLDQNGKPKKSYYSFKLLLDKVAGFDSIQLLESGLTNDDNTTGGNGTWLIEFTVNGTTKWIIWSPDNTQYTLTNLTSSHLIATHVVPTTIDIASNTAQFDKDTLVVINGSVELTGITSLPLLLEPADLTLTALAHPTTTHTAINVYPNPAREFIIIENEEGEPLTATIYTLSGQVVAKKELLSNRQRINISTLPDGVYFLKIATTRKTYTFKLLRSRH